MKKLSKTIFLLILPLCLYSHTLLLNLSDNEDGTMTVEGIFNTGQSAAGALVKLEALNSGKILFEKRLPDDDELIIDIPKVPYQIILDGGPGHTVVKDGIEPPGGFIKVKKEKVKKIEKTKPSKHKRPSKLDIQISSSKAVTYSIIVAFILLLGTILVSIRNTNKILKQLKNQ